MTDQSDKSATFLELFFDLVFVYAITQVTVLIRQEGEVAAFAQAALIFALVWWAWSQFTWVGNAIDMDNRPTRVIVLAATGTAFVMAQGLPDAFGDDGQWFGIAFGVTMTLGLGLYWWGLRVDKEHQRALRSYLPPAGLATLLVVAGGFVDPDLRPWVFVAALVVFALSGMAAEQSNLFRIAPRHFAERHSLIMIIALGEAVIAVGVATRGVERTTGVAFAVGIGIVGALALWWAYFDWFNTTVEHRLAGTAPGRRAPFARDAYTFGHYPLVFGIVTLAVAVEEAIAHPYEPMEAIGRLGLAAGIGLYLAGIAVVYLRAGGIVLIERIVAAVLAVAVVAAFPDLDAVPALAIVVALLIGALVVEGARHRAGALRLR